ncbi:hypothetical protein [Microcystis sp. LEGE 08355]|uniref:hypothetical protein n=1 Tax=Microcystis sp. LEGE 08355 TaxID=1828687 RepID=UPI00187E6C9A|nr:hypothetical protein [Microcystis sp. LEGE 08355]
MIITLYFPLQSIAVIISYQLSVISYQLSVISYQLSDVSFKFLWLSRKLAEKCPLSYIQRCPTPFLR